MSSNAAHVLRVKVLYRRILKEQLNWTVTRDVWLQHALNTRQVFDEGKRLRDAGDIEAAISRGTRWLTSWQHPDPYTSHNNTHSALWTEKCCSAPAWCSVRRRKETESDRE